jgi:hypothetical protein
MAASGGRKSAGNNFGCTLRCEFFRFLFPIIQRRHGDFRLRPAKRDYGGTSRRVSSRHPHKLKLELQPMMSLLTELENPLIRFSTNMPARRAFKKFCVSALIPTFPSPGN